MITTESGRNLYDYNDVSSLTGVGEQTIRKSATRLNITPYFVRGRLYFDESQILQIVEDRKNRKEKESK